MLFAVAVGAPPNEKLGFGASVACVGFFASGLANAEGVEKALEKGEVCDNFGVCVVVAGFAGAPKPKPPKDGKS